MPTGYRILGRERDLYFNAAGQVISSSEIDAVLPEVCACWHWSLVQVSDLRWDFQYVADGSAPRGMAEAIARALGAGVRVNLFRRKFIQPAASGKFSLLKPLAR
jgi:phenylacetate-CoA ligase